jgi:hypothetical protein
LVYLFRKIITNHISKREAYTRRKIIINNDLKSISYLHRPNPQGESYTQAFPSGPQAALKSQQSDLKIYQEKFIRITKDITRMENGYKHLIEHTSKTINLEKPDIDISAQIKIYSDFDVDRLFKF